jgi:toxin CptA
LSSHRERPPLLIEPGFSGRLCAFVLLTHAAAGAAILALPGAGRLLVLPVAASLAYQLTVQVLRRAPWSIRSVLWQSDGTWRITLASGRELEATLSPSTFVSVPLIVLNLRLGRLRHRSLPLFSDVLDSGQLRRLRQRLRIEGTSRHQDAAPA